nr:uncharacterized protein CI109_002197 [Kwoniella shandongensis]KAA5529304.1 hypothetical protein CI109_002197 [Kwoniella shandongensis]
MPSKERPIDPNYKTNPALRPRRLNPEPKKVNLLPHVTNDFSILKRYGPPGYTKDDDGSFKRELAQPTGLGTELHSTKIRRQLEEMDREIRERRTERMIVSGGAIKGGEGDQLPSYTDIQRGPGSGKDA